MPSSVARTKDEWRTQFKAYRDSVSPEQYRAKSALICSRVSALPLLTRTPTVHVYWPLPERGEIDTRPLIPLLRGRGHTVVLPVVTSYPPDPPAMEHRRYEGRDTLTTNRWGIREPAGTPRVEPERLDVVIVPGLGADRRGHRIGHGSGYYDAFLQSLDVPRILLIYDDCFVDSLPAAPHDVPVTTVVTERGVTNIA